MGDAPFDGLRWNEWRNRDRGPMVVREIAGSSGPLNRAQNDEQDDGANHRRDDGADETRADADAQNAGKPATDQGTDNSHDNIAQEAEPAAPDQQAREPTGDRTDDQPNNDAFRAHS